VPLRLFRWLRALLFFLTAPCLIAEYPPIKSWTSADGLAGDSEIDFLMQDSRGYLWICGALETKDGALWFGSSLGLVRYVPDAGAPTRFVSYPFTAPGGITIHAIHSLAEDPRGGLWIGTPRGLFHADPSRGELHVRQDAGLAPNYTGLYQINIVVPNVSSGNAALTFTLAGQDGTQKLYIPISD
jgi:ligand-binding sensor domain-containing protein